MKIVKPSVEGFYNENPQKHIESIGRICYKSEDYITEESNKKFIKNMYSNKHWAMLEHFRFIVSTNDVIYNAIDSIKSGYITCTCIDINGHGTMRRIISASARGLLDALELVENDKRGIYGAHELTALLAVVKHIVWHYGCSELFGDCSPCEQYNMVCIEMANINNLTDYEVMKHGWHSVKFVCDRGVSHEMVRHRPASFAQESTRYCNYAKGKFGGEVSFIEPCFFVEDQDAWNAWYKSCVLCENSYIDMIDNGVTAQEARTVLNNSTKTDLVVTATNEEWKHIIELRHIGVTGKPHPQMFEIMDMMIESLDWANSIYEESVK